MIKVGDMVKMIESDTQAENLVVGKEYEVLEISNECNKPFKYPCENCPGKIRLRTTAEPLCLASGGCDKKDDSNFKISRLKFKQVLPPEYSSDEINIMEIL